MHSRHWYQIGLGVQLVYTGWLSFWTIAILLTGLGVIDGRIGPAELRPFFAAVPAEFLISFYAFNILAVFALLVSLRRKRFAVWVFASALLWDAVNWIIFSIVIGYDNNLQLIVILFGIIGAWCLYQWAISEDQDERLHLR